MTEVRLRNGDSSKNTAQNTFFKKIDTSRDFPGSAVVKDPAANAGDTGSSPGLGRSHMPQSD